MGLGAKDLFVIVTGGETPEEQTAATKSINARLQAWKLKHNAANAVGGFGGFSGTSPPTGSIGGVGGIHDLYAAPKLSTLPDVTNVDASGTAVVGVTILVSASSGYLFEQRQETDAVEEEFPGIEGADGTGTTTAVSDAARSRKLNRLVHELAVHTNCLVQLLPPTHIAVSKQFDLRRLAIIAPTHSVLLETLAIIHRMVTTLTPFEGEFSVSFPCVFHAHENIVSTSFRE